MPDSGAGLGVWGAGDGGGRGGGGVWGGGDVASLSDIRLEPRQVWGTLTTTWQVLLYERIGLAVMCWTLLLLITVVHPGPALPLPAVHPDQHDENRHPHLDRGNA